jgi:hypothetical protein
MRTIPLLLLLAPLAACSSERKPQTGPTPEPSAAAVTSPPPTPAGEDKSFKIENDLIEFAYAWPAAADAQPSLRARLERQLNADRAETLASAREDRSARKEIDAPYFPHALQKTWSVAGSSQRLLSLAAEVYVFTGGAHGMTNHGSLLWDKQSDSEVSRAVVLAPALLEALTERYCAALDEAREEKRGEPVPKNREGMFNECPVLADQTLVPTDTNGDGLFDQLKVLIGPYEAGPYAEGSYEIPLPLDAMALALIPEPWRGAFNAAPAAAAQPQ